MKHETPGLRLVADAFADIISSVDPDSGRSGLVETPLRAARAFQFYTKGYLESPGDVLKEFDSAGYDQMVVQVGIPTWSMCEHHLSPFFGETSIAYIPGESRRIVGLSKLARLVDVFARRLQVQERLTQQVCDALQEHLNPRGVGVIMRCRHTCMEMRGVERAGTFTVTSCMLGDMLEDPSARSEFLSLAHGSFK